MKKKLFGFREFVILAIVFISCYTLWPSILVHSKQGAEKEEFLKENPKLAAKSVNFGLDLAGGTSITLEIDDSNLKDENVKDIQEQSLEIVRNRVDQFGLSEPQISPQGDKRIIVELAGVDDSTAKELVGSTAKLEFKIVADNEKFTQVVQVIDNYLARRNVDVAKAPADSAVQDSAADSSKVVAASTQAVSDAELLGQTAPAATSDSSVAGAENAEKTVAASDENTSLTSLSGLFVSFGNGGFVAEESVEKIKRLLAMEAIQKLIPRDVNFAFGSGLEKVGNDTRVKAKRLYLLKRRAEMDGENISDARPYRVGDGTNVGEVAVSLKFSGVGPKQFSAVTAANVGKQMAIVLDNQVISAPVIRDRIPNGEAQITGLDDMAEANRLSVVLRAGALKAPMNIIESRNIGATLGEDNIKSGFGSGIIGLILVLLFMISYYRFGGLVACVGMVCNIVIALAVLSVFNATLTLPGIAGLILTAGMSVDANVIIYERIREELRNGLNARAAVSKGYARAFTAIFDSNLTTILTGLILYKVGTSSVKGFGLTLMIGIAISMFTALTITRAIFDLKLAKQDSNKLSLGSGIRALIDAKIPFIPNGRLFATISIVLVVLSIGIVAVKGFDFSIDFTGGQVYTIQYEDKDDHVNDLNQLMTAENVKNATIRKLGGNAENTYQVSVRSSQGETVKTLIEQKLSGKALIIASDEVGPTIGKELRFNAILSVILAWIMICLYVWFRFGKFGLSFGVGAVLGLVHNTIIAMGFVSLVGIQMDGALIASILTLIGYSVNDTIVVFDRIREKMKVTGFNNYAQTVNDAINENLSRTLITSVTTLFVCIVIAVMGGSAIRSMGIVLTVGILVGTYASNCLCSPFLVWWATRAQKVENK